MHEDDASKDAEVSFTPYDPGVGGSVTINGIQAAGLIFDEEMNMWALGYWPDGEEWVHLAYVGAPCQYCHATAGHHFTCNLNPFTLTGAQMATLEGFDGYEYGDCLTCDDTDVLLFDARCETCRNK